MSEQTKDQVAEQLKQVNASVEKLKDEALKKAENALDEAKQAGELSQEPKNDVDQVFTDLTPLRDT
ncbi:hypothetical protein J8J23_21805, partial [Mycobacterium tuberculosis]|uniref:hypothetical protein n=1 Tax=Mycobacterium tuberculosis TaxID=1773 RepID=UPI001AE05809